MAKREQAAAELDSNPPQQFKYYLLTKGKVHESKTFDAMQIIAQKIGQEGGYTTQINGTLWGGWAISVYDSDKRFVSNIELLGRNEQGRLAFEYVSPKEQVIEPLASALEKATRKPEAGL